MLDLIPFVEFAVLPVASIALGIAESGRRARWQRLAIEMSMQHPIDTRLPTLSLIDASSLGANLVDYSE